MKTILELKNLSIGFSKILFRDINVELKEGVFACLLGVNGIGKSCLLKTMAGLQDKKNGDIFVDNRNFSEIDSDELAKKIGIVLTEKLQIDYLTVFELVSFGRAPYTGRNGNLSSEDTAIVQKILDDVGIAEIATHYFSELSDGQKQKALIARALAQTPELLLLDEPTTYLDIPSKIDLIELLKRLTREKKITVLLSTHDLDLIKDMADEFWLMGKDGKFSAGSPEDLTSSGLIANNFFRSGLK